MQNGSTDAKNGLGLKAIRRRMAELDLLLARADQWAGTPPAIATAVQTWVSAPRPVGSHTLVGADGSFEGGVSDGRVENDVLSAVMRYAQSGGSSRLFFGAAAAPAAWGIGGWAALSILGVGAALIATVLQLGSLRKAR